MLLQAHLGDEKKQISNQILYPTRFQVFAALGSPLDVTQWVYRAGNY
jgi:hypothetical protein